MCNQNLRKNKGVGKEKIEEINIIISKSVKTLILQIEEAQQTLSRINTIKHHNENTKTSVT